MSKEIRGLLPSELEAHTQLVYESYYEYVASGERPFLADPQFWLKGVQNDPYYEPEHTRVLVLDGRLVSSVTCYTREMYADGRIAKVGCIGSVCTHPDYRRQGYVKEVLAETIAWMQAHSYHFSFLFGREEVYGGSGWKLLTSLEMIAEVQLRHNYKVAAQIRPANTEKEVPVLAEIYTRFNRTLTGPFVRNAEYWQRRVLRERFGPPPVYYLVELEGQPIGYFSGEEGRVREIAWTQAPQQLFAAVLQQWPNQPVRFSCFTSDMIRYVREISEVPNAAALAEHPRRITLQETGKGLWRYIGDSQRLFPEITDTDSLRCFLREHEYNFWPVDSF